MMLRRCVLVAFLLAAPAFAAKKKPEAASCSATVSKAPFKALEKHLKRAVAHANKKPVRFDLQQGHATVDTATFFPPKLVRPLFDLFPNGSSWLLVASGEPFRDGEVLSDAPFPTLGDDYREALLPFVRWLLERINASLPADEQVVVSNVDVRFSAASTEVHAFPAWHQDGDDLAATVSLLGDGTEHWIESPALDEEAFEKHLAEVGNGPDFRQTPEGQTLIFSALERFRRTGIAATVHRSSPCTRDRLLLLIRFKRVKR